jgi:glutamate-ammonia-ligase adenylyltransferase
MQQSFWEKAIKSCADPVRARRLLEMLAASSAGATLNDFSPAQAGVLVTLFGGSQALGNLVAAHPDWLSALDPESLKFPRREQGLRRELAESMNRAVESRDYPAALKSLRVFQQREMLRVAARDLARFGSVSEITEEISDVADVCLGSVWQICLQQLTARYGSPFHRDAGGNWQPTAGCLLGLGKLGGRELNYSSDVDVMFVYDDEGSVFAEAPTRRQKPREVMTSHQFFERLAEAVIAEVVRLTPEGTLYRIDLRLRPEGDTGPLSRSVSSYENYYAQWGQTWERMMLIKARGVAGSKALAAEFIEMIQPFRYARSVSPGVLHEVAAMKDRIEKEVVKAGELERNVKLGRGGIREIEFIAQTLQLLHAGRQPFLQEPGTLASLERLAQHEWLTAAEFRSLAAAYRFLREVEHRLQMENNLQTHTIPVARHARERLARLMGCSTEQQFEDARREHTGAVRRIFHRLLKADVPESERTAALPFPQQFQGAEAQWKRFLAAHGFAETDQALRVVREFVEGPGYIHVSPRTSQLALRLLPRVFSLCPTRNRGIKTSEAKLKTLSDPDRVALRLDSFISAYGARATLFELWNGNPSFFELLLALFDRSDFLAELAIRTPDLVDELMASGRLRQRKSAEETLRDLRHGLSDEDQHLWLRRYHQAELMRIGLRDILGLADFEQYLSELSALAAACLQYALEVVMRWHKLKTPPFAIIGLGKLGGAEIDYGSDLDILFVAEAKTKEPARLLPFAIELMDLLSRRTEQGIAFHTDARLRPDGEKGLLVNTMPACEKYYRRRAQLWEIQTLTRARPIAGLSEAGEQFQKMAATLTNFARPSLPLAAFERDWKRKIHKMRLRIEKERTRGGKDELAIKTGRGGLMDAEFIAQMLCLENGWQEPNTLRALERGRRAGALPQAAKLIENYRRLRRVEAILRRWSCEGESVLPEDLAVFRRVSTRCGFASPNKFRASVEKYRTRIREVYLSVFGRKNKQGCKLSGKCTESGE